MRVPGIWLVLPWHFSFFLESSLTYVLCVLNPSAVLPAARVYKHTVGLGSTFSESGSSAAAAQSSAMIALTPTPPQRRNIQLALAAAGATAPPRFRGLVTVALDLGRFTVPRYILADGDFAGVDV